MDWREIGITLDIWMEEEWYMGLYVFFGFVLIFALVKLARIINSFKKFPKL